MRYDAMRCDASKIVDREIPDVLRDLGGLGAEMAYCVTCVPK